MKTHIFNTPVLCSISSILLVCLLITCQNQTNKTPIENTDSIGKKANISEIKKSNDLFSFDSVCHYHLVETKNIKILKDDPINLNEDLIMGSFPDSINDPRFYKLLESNNYQRQEFDNKHLATLRNTIRDGKSPEVVAACIPHYTDILVFKEKGKDVAMLKICFGCSQIQWILPNKITSPFGNSDDFIALKKLLKNSN